MTNIFHLLLAAGGGAAVLAVYQIIRAVGAGATWRQALTQVIRPQGGGGGGPPLPP